MLGKKKNSPPPAEAPMGVSQVMPDLFYGGKDPNIYESQGAGAAASVASEPISPEDAIVAKRKAEIAQRSTARKVEMEQAAVQKPPLEKARADIQKPLVQRVEAQGSHKGLIITIIIVLLVGGAGIAWYAMSILQQPKAPLVSVSPSPAVSSRDVETPPVVEAPVVVPPVVEQPPMVPVEQPTEVTLSFPRTLLVSAADIDADALTDLEEEAFNTDSGTWDSDGDGYYDGLEIVNLYSPNGVAPSKLIDSGLIGEYVNPNLQYRLYYPLGWTVDAVDPNAVDVLVSSIQGEYVHVHAFQKRPGDSFVSWFGREASQQQLSDISSFNNRFQIAGYIRDDRFVAYYETDRMVYALIYRSTTDTVASFPHIMEMIVQSFRPTDQFIDVPQQRILPTPEVPVTEISTSSDPFTLEPSADEEPRDVPQAPQDAETDSARDTLIF